MLLLRHMFQVPITSLHALQGFIQWLKGVTGMDFSSYVPTVSLKEVIRRLSGSRGEYHRDAPEPAVIQGS